MRPRPDHPFLSGGDELTEICTDAFGGLLIRQGGHILMRESAGHQGGYVWTFAKAHPQIGETPENAAFRAVRERLGWKAVILGQLDEAFAGTSSSTRFFVMGAVGRQGKFSARTAATRWVSLDDAERLIRQSWHPTARERDLAVVAALRRWLDGMAWADRPPACAADWERLRALPKKRRRLRLDHLYDAAAAARITKGFIPAEEEQKWLAWYDGTILHLHRSWTGSCIYRVSFAPEGSGLRAVSAWANRDPEQYLETDDDADRRALIGLIDGLFIHAPDAKPVDHLAEAFMQLAQPNYLGSPAVVREFLQPVIAAAIVYAKGEANFNGVWDLVWNSAQEFAAGEIYTRIPAWHTAAALGQNLYRCFHLQREPLFANDLDYPVSEALMALFLKVRDMALAFEADANADWQTHALPRLNALHEWAVTVFLGTNDLLHSGVTLKDFKWARVDPSGLPLPA